jgi:S-adenosylmethionine:tRNA ribosyltransferase-isomerase
MKLSQYVYDLPLNLIAQTPSKNRDESKLMVVHKDTGKIEHKLF